MKKHYFVTLILVLGLYWSVNTAFTALGRHHFEMHCEQDAGEFIYKTVDDVEGIFQMRPRDPDEYISNLRRYRLGNGKLLDDPFGHTNAEAKRPHTLFLGLPFKGFHRYQYFETSKSPDIKRYDISSRKEFASRPEVTGEKYWIYTLLRVEMDGTWKRPIFHVEQISELKSRYGFTWQEVRDRWDRLFGIWGGELLVKDLQTDETLAIRRGYFSFKFGICPKDKSGGITYLFLNKVLKPIKKNSTLK